MLAATAQDGPARLGLHAGAEPELLLARALGRLVCAFHNKIFKWGGEVSRKFNAVNVNLTSPTFFSYCSSI